MQKSVPALFVILALVLLGAGLAPVTAAAQDDVAPSVETVAPLPITSVHMRGDVFANGAALGPIDFAVIWSEEDPSAVQLWALLDNTPTVVCIGEVFETPQGEPIFFGTTSLLDPAGTCHMARLPDHSGISLFAASDDGQWASAILRNPNATDPLPIFE